MTILLRKLAEWIGDWAPQEIVGGLPYRQAAEVYAKLTESMERARMHGAKLALE